MVRAIVSENEIEYATLSINRDLPDSLEGYPTLTLRIKSDYSSKLAVPFRAWIAPLEDSEHSPVGDSLAPRPGFESGRSLDRAA